ncbi:MAG TPA: beta-ketoacyl-ACP synthase III [Fimbriimonadales bacterium]|nr:beta-ketoacyl-ACP synthase III [Fimbriimonadales bacterium]
MQSKRAVIQSIGMSVAEKVMTNQEFEKILDTSDEWIRTRTGIVERRIAKPDEAASDFAIRASREALERANASPESLDLICVASVTGDRLFPSTSCLVQAALGAKNAAAFDVGAACAGFIYACEIVGSMIQSGSIHRALVIGVDVLTKFVDWSDRSTAILFGDGGGAAYMESGEGDRGVIATVMHSDGEGAERIRIQIGGSRFPVCAPHSKGQSPFLYMEGREVYRFAVKAMGESCCEVLKKAGMNPEDVTLFVPHQANLRIIQAAADRIGLPWEKVFINVDKYGNMGAGSIPVALYEAEQSGMLKKGDVVLTVGFGAGLIWGANLIRW